MKKILCLVLAIMLLLTCVGCGSQMETVQDTKENANTSMFVLIESATSDIGYRIVYHKETKVMYAVSAGYYNTGTFTVMLDADGKPLLWEG